MEKDADGNYYYAEGTVNEQMDDVDVYEKSDGTLGVAVSGSEVRVDEFAHIFGSSRTTFTEEELGDGEVALYISNGDGAGAAGDLVIARGSSTDDGTVVTEEVVYTSP